MKKHKDKIRFGPSGNSDIFYEEGYKASYEAPLWLHKRGLSAYEYSFGHGVRLGEDTAKSIGDEAKKYDIRMSVHLPYYINLSAQDKDKREKTKVYFMDSFRIAKALGAQRGVFHMGSAAGESRGEAFKRANELLQEIYCYLETEGYGDIALCPETMGKINQLGDLKEVLDICSAYKKMLPCIDFGHLHCRSMGGIKTKSDYADILNTIENKLGLERAKNIHVHFSRIEFTKMGEKRHHTFKDTQYGPEFMPLAELLAERNYSPIIICESKGTMAEDAQTMKKMFKEALHKRHG